MNSGESGARGRKFTRACALLIGAFALGCASTPATDSTPSEAPPVETKAVVEQEFSARIASFSADRTWRDLQELTRAGARSVGSRGNDRARNYLRAQLEKLGLQVESHEVDYASLMRRPTSEGDADAPVTNLAAVIPGTHYSDRILLVAPFDSRTFDDFEFVGANDGASGAAVVLEMARAIAANPFPYATEIVFLDGESPFPSPDGRKTAYREIGSLGLASRIRDSGVSSVRLMFYINQVGDADLRIARDLVSHRIYREEIWRAADSLDRSHAFPRDASYEHAGLAHRYFTQVGLRQIVSIVDTSFGGDQPPGLYAGTDKDTIDRCSPESLETVGVVVLEALDAISERLAKIDRFARSGLERGGVD
jgi:glutaminyl-peptide cyclotransferase